MPTFDYGAPMTKQNICSRCRLRPASNGGYCRECRILYQRERRASQRQELDYLKRRCSELEIALRVVLASIGQTNLPPFVDTAPKLRGASDDRKKSSRPADGLVPGGPEG